MPPPHSHPSLPPGFSSPGAAPNARGEPPRHEGWAFSTDGHWRGRLQCVVRPRRAPAPAVDATPCHPPHDPRPGRYPHGAHLGPHRDVWAPAPTRCRTATATTPARQARTLRPPHARAAHGMLGMRCLGCRAATAATRPRTRVAGPRLAGPPPTPRAWLLRDVASGHGMASQTGCGYAETPVPLGPADRWRPAACDKGRGTPTRHAGQTPGVALAWRAPDQWAPSADPAARARARRRRRGRRPAQAPPTRGEAPGIGYGDTAVFPQRPPATDLRHAEPNATLQAPLKAGATQERTL